MWENRNPSHKVLMPNGVVCRNRVVGLCRSVVRFAYTTVAGFVDDNNFAHTKFSLVRRRKVRVCSTSGAGAQSRWIIFRLPLLSV